MKKSGKETKEMKGMKWYILLIAAVASVPLMTDYVLEGSCLEATLSRIRVISQGLGTVFPIRVGTLGNMDYGYSAAAFQADVFYLIPGLLHFLGVGLGEAYKLTLLLFNLLTAAVACRCFEKCTGRREVGVVGGMLYTWCPYRCSEMYLTGDLGEMAAWTFLPLLALGMKLLYTEDREGGAGSALEYGRLWVLLTWSFSLLAVSSTVFLFLAVAVTVLVLAAMGRETIKRRTLVVVGKTVGAVLAVNAWFLVPMLLRMRDVSVVGPMILQDVRSRGMYIAQYFTVFSWGGDGVLLGENGMYKARAMGPGIAVILILLFYLWILFARGREERWRRVVYGSTEGRFAGRMLCVSAALMLFSLNAFPWDIFQNKNMVFSIILALLYSPAKLGIAADMGLIVTACILLGRFAEVMEEKSYKLLLLAVACVSFGTTQFLLGKILTTQNFVRQAEIEAFGNVPFSLVTEESIIWRFCEAVSVAALFVCGIMWIMRRRKSAS